MHPVGTVRAVRRPWVIVAVAFGVTRLVAGWIADHPEDVYPAGSANPSFDIANYAVWGNQMQDFGNWPYREFELEYPPGALAVANGPYWVSDEGFQEAYIVQSVAFDAFGLLAVYRLASRRHSWWGVAAWLVLVPLLGPVSYTRLDIVVAAAVAWALERAIAGRWAASGAWLGLGVAVKLTPGLILPALAIVAPRRWRPMAAAGVVAAAFVVPFVGDLPEVADQVFGYHLERGVHAESLWGSLALGARWAFDADVELVSAFGASDIRATAADELKTLSNVAAVGVLLDGALTARRRVRRGDGAHLAVAVCGAFTLLTAVGRVFSPQYLVWLVAPMAVALTVAPRAMRWPAILFGCSVALAHLVYPVLFFDYLAVEGLAVAAGVGRNLLLVAAGVLGVRAAWRYEPSELPAVEEHEPVEPVLADVLVRPDR